MPQAAADQQTEVGDVQQSKVVDDKSATGDQAAAARSGVPDNSAGDDAADEAAAIELIPKTRYDELKGDPVKLHKELNRAATKKFQEMSKERKALAPYSGFIAALEEDAPAAIRAIGTQLGIKFAEEEGGGGTATDINDLILEDVKKSLGPEYEDLAEKLAPAIRQVAERVAASVAKPIEDRVGEVISDSAVRESKLAMDAFAVKHPDWKDHEEAMVAMSSKLPPGPGLSESEYLENIYYLVTRETSSGDAVKKVVDKMTKSAAAGGKTTSSVSEDKVSLRPTKPPTFQEAYQAAKRGEKYE